VLRNVKVYSTPTCPYCKMAKKFFQENNISFEDIDVSINQTAASEMINKSGQMGVPVIEIDGKIIIGFNKPEIKTILGLQ